MKQALKLGCWFSLWFFSSGQQNFEVSDLAPKTQQVEVPLQWIFGGGAIIVLLIVILMVQIQLKRKSEFKMRQKYNFDHAEQQLNSMMGSGPNAFELRKLMETVLGTKDPFEIMNFSRSLVEFDKRSEEYLELENNSAEAQKALTQTRKLLNLSLNNSNISFTSSKLLPIGQALQCQAQLGKRKLKFDSTVLAQSESKLLIKTPQVGERPVEIKDVAEISCQIDRHKDGIYEFRLPFLAQKQGKHNVLVMNHSSDIKLISKANIDKDTLEEEWYME
jgi:hypothetical protein